MHNQGKYSCISRIYSIKHHHGDYGKMPRTRSIRGRDDNSKRTANEHD